MSEQIEVQKRVAASVELKNEELVCLQAVADELEKISQKIKVDGYTGEPTDNRIYVRHLMRDVMFNKYQACVENLTPASTPGTPMTDPSRARQK